MKKIINWVMAVILVICGEAVFTACSSDNGDNPVGNNSLTEMIVGKWIHTDTDGEAVTTDMKSVYTFTKDGAVLKGHYSMSMTESGVWAYNQETDVTISGNTITMTSFLADGVISVVELTDVSVSSDDLRFTAKTTLTKNGQVTATYGPRQEHFTKVDADYTEAVVGLWEITFTSDNPEYESSVPYRELYRADGTASFYDLIDGQWVEEETTYSEYFADGPLFCFRWQKPGQEGRHENWEIVSCTGDEMVNKAFHRRADGSTYTITAHLKKVEKFDARKYALVDLHLHLDGSLSVDDAIYMASVDGVSLPASRSEIEKLLVCPEDCESLNDYLKCFDLPVSIMQSSTTIAYSVKSLVKRLDEQGLIYAEIRYAPQLHLQKGLTMDEVTAASIEGLKAGMAESTNGIKAQLILCCMRGEGNDELNMQTVDVAKKYLGQGVCAIDIAGAEALYPTSKYRELFAYAKTQGVPFTIHAGEADGVESMKLAVEYGAKRIGHGVRAFDDAETKQLLIQNDICLTLCPTSNLQTKALAGVTRMSQYPLQAFIADGVPYASIPII